MHTLDECIIGLPMEYSGCLTRGSVFPPHFLPIIPGDGVIALHGLLPGCSLKNGGPHGSWDGGCG